jgi:hypothetical protein
MFYPHWISIEPHLFGTLDPDPDRIGCIRIRIRIETNADPQHWMLNPFLKRAFNWV